MYLNSCLNSLNAIAQRPHIIGTIAKVGHLEVPVIVTNLTVVVL